MKNVYTRLRQLTAGFIPIREGGTRRNIYFDKNPKLEALLDLLEEIPGGEKVIVFNEFVSSGDRISEEFTKLKVPFVRLFSGTADKVGTVDKFKKDKKIRVLLGSRSLCYGLNLQLAHHMIVFESPDSTILRDQLEHRIVRMGQTEHSFIWDLLVENSVDGKILQSLRDGRDLFTFLMESEDPYGLLVA
ncbi:MAG: DEAD/DEAH box helicase [Gemmatimonadales bacterium]|nr:MAG: DEAD/DEAH box helicase [Gemmatimonadales bacterium]